MHVLVALALLSAAPPLPPLRIDPLGVSVSGVSSGADMAVQLQVAFSATFAGAGIFAGQAGGCAVTRFPGDTLVPRNGSAGAKVPVCEGCPVGRTLTYDHCKRHPEVVQVPTLVARARAHAAAGRIDALASLAGRRVLLYRGTNDTCYNTGAVNATAQFLLGAGVAARDLVFVRNVSSPHLLPTTERPLCDWEEWPACDFDGAGAALRWIYEAAPGAPPLAPRAADTRATWQHLAPFDQTPFFGDGPFAGFGPNGTAFVPPACRRDASATGGHGGGSGDDADAGCRLHVFLHGCGAGGVDPDGSFEMFSKWGGFTNWAATNRIVVLFPLIDWGAAAATGQEASGCYDGYGQTGPDYDTRSGAQMAVLRRMVDAALQRS
jgi:poly(3-hydroxybutyrate) depolymerase